MKKTPGSDEIPSSGFFNDGTCTLEQKPAPVEEISLNLSDLVDPEEKYLDVATDAQKFFDSDESFKLVRYDTRSGKTYTYALAAFQRKRVCFAMPQHENIDDFIPRFDKVFKKKHLHFPYTRILKRSVGCANEELKRIYFPSFCAHFTCSYCNMEGMECNYKATIKSVLKTGVHVACVHDILNTPVIAAAHAENPFDTLIIDEDPTHLFIRKLSFKDAEIDEAITFMNNVHKMVKGVISKKKAAFLVNVLENIKKCVDPYKNARSEYESDVVVNFKDREFSLDGDRLINAAVGIKIDNHAFRIPKALQIFSFLDGKYRVRRRFDKIYISTRNDYLLDFMSSVEKKIVLDASGNAEIVSKLLKIKVDSETKKIVNTFPIFQRNEKPFGMLSLSGKAIDEETHEAKDSGFRIILGDLIEIIENTIESDRILVVSRKSVQKRLAEELNARGIRFSRIHGTYERKKENMAERVVLDIYPLRSTSIYEKINYTICFGGAFRDARDYEIEADLLGLDVKMIKHYHECTDLEQAIGRSVSLKKAFLLTNTKTRFTNVKSIVRGEPLKFYDLDNVEVQSDLLARHLLRKIEGSIGIRDDNIKDKPSLKILIERGLVEKTRIDKHYLWTKR